MGRRCSGLAAATPLALVLAVPVAAHDLWLEPDAAALPPRFHLCVGEHLSGEERPLSSERGVAEWVAAGAAGERTPLAQLRYESVLAPALPAGAIAGVLLYGSRPAPITLKPDRFEFYIREERLLDVIDERRRRGETGKPGRELYSRAAKALVGTAADPAAATRVYDLRFELVPEQDPRALRPGARFPVRLLWERKPAAGVVVRLLRRSLAGCGAEELGEETSDADGRVWLPVGEGGLHLVKALHVSRSGRPDADWESVWGSLTFVRPGSRSGR